MVWVRLTFLFVCVYACLGCNQIPTLKVDQSAYCFADFAYEAKVIRHLPNWDEEITVNTSIGKIYKGNSSLILPKLHGFWGACRDKHSLWENSTYLFYAKYIEKYGEVLFHIVAYTDIAKVTKEDINRMLTKYDCTCQIYVPDGAPHDNLPAPSECPDQCNAPNNVCPRSGICTRNSNGVCTWKDLGKCR